jgi:hypothetical protein
VDIGGLLRTGDFDNRSDSAGVLMYSVDGKKSWNRLEIGESHHWFAEETKGSAGDRPSNEIHRVYVYSLTAGNSYFSIRSPTYWQE